VRSAIGALVTTTRLDASHPQFLQIGLDPAALEPFGVQVVAGRAYTDTATDEIMLGWQAAEDLGKHVGDSLRIDRNTYRVVGIYSLKQVFGDTASMVPLIAMQASERKPGTVTLIAVQVKPGATIDQVRKAIEAEYPNLATVRLASEFGRVDRNIEFLQAAKTGATIVALLIGIIIVMNTMLLSFIERIREFGLLRALGWTRRRLVSLVMGEALTISLLGAALGVGLAFLLTFTLANASSLQGFLQPEYSASIFATALYSAVGIGLISALYPSLRAGALRPGVALRKE
jgi:putative ABC transport system permease protein